MFEVSTVHEVAQGNASKLLPCLKIEKQIEFESIFYIWIENNNKSSENWKLFNACTISSNETIICLLTSKVPAHDLIKTGIRYKNTSDISKLETYVIKCENKHTIRHDSKI